MTKPVWWFLDDEREPPNDKTKHWVIVRSGETLIEMVRRYEWPDGMSLDHDLGDGVMTGADAVSMLAKMILDCDVKAPVTAFQYVIHSQNPVGAKNIEGHIKDIFAIAEMTDM